MVIVGGDAAGMSAASRLARTARDVQVTVFEREGVISYAACGMPYHLDRRIPDAGALLIRSPEDFGKLGITVRLHHEVLAIDPDARTLSVRAGDRERVEPYDSLLLATGAEAVVPPLPGAQARNVFTFRRYQDLQLLAAYLRRARPKAMTVVGGGYVGIELAEVLCRCGIEVCLTEAEESLMPGTLDAEVAGVIARELERCGVRLRLGRAVEALGVSRGRAREVQTASESWPCDAVIMAVGVRPASRLAREAGIPLESNGAIITDSSLRTGRRGVWAAGDCASTTDLVTGGRTWVPLGPAANKQGRVAGDSIAGRRVRFEGVVGTALVKAFDLEIGRTGLTETAARQAGFAVVGAQITAGDRAPYYPGGSPTSVKLIADAVSGRLLGAQITGAAGVAGRTNVVAAALHARMDVEQFVGLDLGYAPQFAPVWDPLLVAASQILGRLPRAPRRRAAASNGRPGTQKVSARGSRLPAPA